MDTVLQNSENVFSVPSENDRKADEKLYKLNQNFKNEKEKNQKLEAEVKKLASDLKTERQIYLAEKKILEERAENAANNSKNMETHQEEFETLKKELEEGRKFEAQLMKETDRLVIQVEKLKRENLAKQNPHKNESGGTRELEQDIKILTLERTDFLGRIDALRSELTTVKKDKETLELQIRDNVADKTTVYGNTELENLRTAISELEKTRTDQAEIIEQNKTEKIQLESNKAELMEKLESEKTQFLSEKKLLQDELSKMQKNLQEVQEEKNQLSSNFLEMETKFQAELDACNIAANANIEKMKLSQQAELNALKQQHDSAKALFETQMTEQKVVVKYFKDELDKAVKSSDELRKEKHRLTMENEDLKRGNSTQNFNIGNVQIKKEPDWEDGCQSVEENVLAMRGERQQAEVNAVEQQHDHAEASIEKGMEESLSGVTATQPETLAEERTNSRTGPDSQPLVDSQRSLKLPSHDTGAGYESILTEGGPEILKSQAANDATDDAASATEKNHDIDTNHVSFPTIGDPDVLSSQAADDADENTAKVTKKGKRAKKQPTARTKRVAKQANLPPDENENEDVPPSPKKNRRKTKKPPKSDAVVTATAETDEEDSGTSKTLKELDNPTAQSPTSIEQSVASENAKKGAKSRKRGAKTDGPTTGQDEAPSPEKKTRTKRKTKNNEEMASEDSKELASQIKTPQNKRGAKKTVNKIQDDASVTSTKKKPQPKRGAKKKVQFDALEEDIESEPTPTPSTSQQAEKGAEKMVNEPEEMSDSGESPPSTKTNPRKKRGVKNEVEDKSDEPKEKPPARKKTTRRKNSEDQDDAPPIEEVESTKTKSTRNKKKNKAAETAQEINVAEDLEAAPEAQESADLGSPKKGGGDTAKKPRKPRAKKQTKKEEGPSDSSLPTLWETTEETGNKTSPVKRNRRKRN